MKSKKVACLFCTAKLPRKAAKQHGCPEKRTVEQRLGAQLAVYNAVEHSIEK